MNRHDDVVRAAYAARAQEYTDLLGSMDATDPADRRLVAGWATRCPGPVVDVGCGPGHWTSHLAGLGVDVEGVDLVPAFVGLARSRFPSVRYRVAGLDDLGLPARSVSGILAWYSLIHLAPARMPGVLRGLAGCLQDGGSLLVGFFASAHREPFDHAVTTACSWPVDELTALVEDVGLVVDHLSTRPNPGRPDRLNAALLARRTDHGGSPRLSSGPGRPGPRPGSARRRPGRPTR